MDPSATTAGGSVASVKTHDDEATDDDWLRRRT
jgi:hypothetical protein